MERLYRSLAQEALRVLLRLLPQRQRFLQETVPLGGDLEPVAAFVVARRDTKPAPGLFS